MSTLQIRIEQDLYDQIKAISKSNDISVSDSINAYLRAVVQTNSLSVNTQLSGAPAPTPTAPTKQGVQLKMVEPKKRKADTFSQVPLGLIQPEKPQPEMKVDGKDEQPEQPEEPTLVPIKLDEKKSSKRVSRQVQIPELKGTLVNKFITLICSIPDGFLSTWEDLEWVIGGEDGAVEKPLHDEWPRTVTIPTEADSEARQGKSVAVPYWRVLSWAGSTKGEVTCNRDLREAMLAAEGHELVTTGRGMRVVRGYRGKLVEWIHPAATL